MMEAIVHPRESRAGSRSSTSIAKTDDQEQVGEVETGWVKEELDSGEIVAIRDPDDFPDGGLQAWSVCVGAACFNIVTFGYVNAWGAFQIYYETVLLKGTSASVIAWIGSLQACLTFLVAVFAGRLFDIGWFKVPILAASLLLVVATILVGECTKYWQLFLCQGLATGIATGAIFGPVMAVLSHWFKRRRATALGVLAFGASIGGTILPIAFRDIEVKIGFKWTMRAFALILLFFMTIGNLLVRRRLPPVRVQGGMFNPSVFKSPAFCMYTASSFVAFLGLFTVLTYIGVSSPEQGASENMAFYLVSIANGAGGVGRLAFGVLGDYWGPMNAMVPLTILTAVTTYAWPFVFGQPSLIAIAIFYGIGSQAYIGLLPTAMINFGETADVGRRMGLYMSLIACSTVVGPPISGAILENSGKFDGVGAWAGSMIVLALLLLLITRYLVLGRFWGKI